jgi:sugar phosphate isomerase/epimerase
MNPIFVMDTAFYNSLGNYSWEARCAILRHLGVESTYPALWNDLALEVNLCEVATSRDRYGVGVRGLYVMLDLADGGASRTRILDLAHTIEGTRHIDLALADMGTPAWVTHRQRDGEIEEILTELLAIAEERDLMIALYPHVTLHLEEIPHAVHWCEKLAHPRLRLTFNGYHWFASDSTPHDRALEQAMPHLAAVTLSGSRRGSGPHPTIEPLDTGELDNFAIVSRLAGLAYRGPIGVQGYSVGGDPAIAVERSVTALRGMLARSTEDWARRALRPESI